MVETAKILNVKPREGAPVRLAEKLAEVVQISARRRAVTRSKALTDAWQKVWALPETDPGEIHWVGVDPCADGLNLGQVCVETMVQQQAHSSPRISRGGPLFFQAVIADGIKDRGWPVPVLARGSVPFSQSDLEHYPINHQGARGQETSTQRVHTLGAYLAEPDVWPQNHAWATPYFPVYYLTVFMPVPKKGANEASSFFPDYCFRLQGSRPLIVHEIVEDRVLPYSYHETGEGERANWSSSFSLALTDTTLTNQQVPTHCLFRAEAAPTLRQAIDAQEASVFGRFIFLVMQQPEAHRSTFSGGGHTLMQGFSISGSSVAEGRTLEPVRYGPGAALDPGILPTIFSVRVLCVQEDETVEVRDLEAGAKVLPFHSCG